MEILIDFNGKEINHSVRQTEKILYNISQNKNLKNLKQNLRHLQVQFLN